MTLELERPDAAEDLYLARGSEVDFSRPIIQGDIFKGVTIVGVEADYRYAMVIQHPCSMRAGAIVKARLQMHPIIEYAKVSLGHWGTKHLRVFPLPEMDPTHPDRHFAVSFEEIGMVASKDLALDSRVVCLSELGMLLLQQRQIFNQARTKVETSTLREHEAHIFEEVDLQEDWNRALVPARLLAHEDIDTALASEAQEFDAYLCTPAEGGGTESLRDRLKAEFQRASVRRQVRQEIAIRAELQNAGSAASPDPDPSL